MFRLHKTIIMPYVSENYIAVASVWLQLYTFLFRFMVNCIRKIKKNSIYCNAFKISFLKTEFIYFINDLNTADVTGYPDKSRLCIL